ncbi:MAG: ATP-binding protein [Chryseolinea sp.]
MNRRRDKVFILLVVSIGMTIICGFVTWWGTQEKRESVDLVIHTYQVIESSERILSLIKDMESGNRGYAIVQDSAFLENYLEAQDLLVEESARLQTLVGDNDTQSRFLKNKILPAFENRKNASLTSVTVVNIHGRDSAHSLIASQVGKAYMDTISVLVNHFIQNEQVSLTDREQELEQNIVIEDVIQFSSFMVIGITCTMAFLRLIRERKSINNLLEKLEEVNEGLEQKVKTRTTELTEANDAKDHFLGIASHDLKVPIAGVLALIEIMRLENTERTDQDNEYLSYMEESCKGMQHLISNLLDINRIDRGETTFSKQRIDLYPFLTRLEKGFETNAKKKGIPLVVNKVEAVLESDPGYLSRILENLVSNAIKFSTHGQAVSIKTTVDNKNIHFDVEDHGPGIPTSEIPLLFRKFSRLTNRPTAGESSSGLGLAIVKELTEMAGGTLSVKSTLKQGTTFTVTLPLE